MQINKIEPPYWYIGLAKIINNLHIMIYGEDLNDVEVETDLAHIGNITTTQDADSHYSIFHLNIDPNAVVVGEYEFRLSKQKQYAHFNYKILNEKENNIEKVTPKDVLYLIMPDRFSHAKSTNPVAKDVDRQNPNGWHGGNIQGVKNHLDYLCDLGVTALWLTPIAENKMAPVKEKRKKYEFYHGYAATDFYAVDPHFGSLSDYQELVSAAHKKGMKVVMDMVLNHCGISHPWVKHLPTKTWLNESNPDKARRTNYRLTTIVDPYRSYADANDTVKGWFSGNMPDINMEDKEVLNYFIQLSLWWIASTGIDAIRVDTYPYVNLESMKRWQQAIHQVYPKLSIIAEAWVDEPAFTAEVQKRNSDGDNALIVMDFAFQGHLQEFMLGRNREKSSYALYNHFVYDYLYKDATQTLAFLDNHDMQRWAYLCKDIQKTKQTIGILLTMPRIPQLLYGTELGFKGDGGTDDGNFRQDFPGGWDDDSCNKFLESGRTDEEQEIFHFTKTLLKWRKSSKAITKGTMKHFIPHNGIYAYFRTFKNEKIMVIVNCKNTKGIVDLKQFAEETNHCSKGSDVLTGQEYLIDTLLNINENGILILNLS